MITNQTDLYWLAGLLEGEGTFDLHSGKYPRVRLGMTDKDVVGRVSGMFGTELKLTLLKAPHTSMWTARIQGAPAAALMRQILPLMGSRRSSKIAGILATWELRNSDRKSIAFGDDIERPPLAPKVGRQLVAV